MHAAVCNPFFSVWYLIPVHMFIPFSHCLCSLFPSIFWHISRYSFPSCPAYVGLACNHWFCIFSFIGSKITRTVASWKGFTSCPGSWLEHVFWPVFGLSCHGFQGLSHFFVSLSHETILYMLKYLIWVYCIQHPYVYSNC